MAARSAAMLAAIVVACVPDRPMDAPTDDPVVDGGASHGGSGDAAAAGPRVTDSPPCNGKPACDRIVFVSYEGARGDAVASVADADAVCLRSASSSTSLVKGRTFRAWVSDATSSAASRLVHGQGRYRLISGTVIANDWSDLVDGTLRAPINEDENGVAVTGSVWTHTAVDGSYVAGCLEGGQSMGQSGLTRAEDAQWTASPPKRCGERGHVYCFED